ARRSREIHRMIQQSRPCSGRAQQKPQAAQRRGWSHGGEPLSLTTWPGCARPPPFRQRTSPETETRKAEPANKSLIDRRLSAPSPALCSQLQLRDTDPAVSRNARSLPRPLTSDIRVSE